MTATHLLDPAGLPPLDPAAIRAQFPILSTAVRGLPLVYLDNAASSQKPDRVIDAVADYYLSQHANIHRGAYQLSQNATRRYEEARATVAAFINAADAAECIFTRGTTESINLVAAAWGRANLRPNDEIVLSELEHHSNIVPWQMIAQATGALIRAIPIDDAGELRLDAYRRLLGPRTRLVAVTAVSNALGTVNPVAEIVKAAHQVDALVLIDGAQWVAHGPTDVQALDCDFFAFSGHKLYGPTGIGVLYGKRHLLEAMPPYQGGGDMIERVTFQETTYAELPNKFEAGTPHIAGAIGLAAAIDWLGGVGLARAAAHEALLLRHATERLAAIPGVAIKGTAAHKAGVLSWVVTDPPLGTLDIGTGLDLKGICIRTGHHCCQPLMDRLGLTSTARASFGVYNTIEEVDHLADELAALIEAARAAAAAARAGAPTPTASAGPVYPAAQAQSPAAAAAEIDELFELLPDWSMRYQQLMDQGARLPTMPEALKTPANLVFGCQSLVHMDARVRPGTSDIIEFLADSDASIVRGLLALLQQLFSGQRAAAILAFDIEAFFHQVGLDEHLSLGRRNGLAAMVQRLRQLASQVEQAELTLETPP
ncbi:SufS family cysteine desulfurase [uncultured Thiodictyon sp.]|uniref:SufS family cysteine desulfurase n=1 Tax=uncultured Thiodictyon sp. TaxID=1846217 RepID=UPI0025F83BD2|nr:SufS family cysteine desulfurase [uncultured Thiodictyon sp.]